MPRLTNFVITESDKGHAEKAVAEVTLTAATPVMQAHYARARNLWREYCRAFGKQFTQSSVPTSEDVLKLTCILIDRVKPRNSDRNAPCLSTIKGLVACILTVLHFEFRGFREHWTTTDRIRLTSLLNDACNSKKLIRGFMSKQMWVSVYTLRRIMTSWFQFNITQGIHVRSSWGHVVLKALGVVLLSACSARPGDLYPDSKSYEGLYLRFKDVVLGLDKRKLRNKPASMDDLYPCLYMVVTLHHTKGQKLKENTVLRLLIEPLTQETDFPICPIALLLAHCLRNDLVYGETVADVISDALRSDGLVRWKQPEYPVLCGLAKNPPDLSTPWRSDSFTMQLQEMAPIAGISDRISARHLRTGAARDISHVKDQQLIPGVANRLTAAALGHDPASFFRGVTDRYSGDPQVPFYNLRVQGNHQELLAPVNMGTGLETTLFSRSEVTATCSELGLNPEDAACRSVAIEQMKQYQINEWRKHAAAQNSLSEYDQHSAAAQRYQSSVIATGINDFISSLSESSDETQPSSVVNDAEGALPALTAKEEEELAITALFEEVSSSEPSDVSIVPSQFIGFLASLTSDATRQSSSKPAKALKCKTEPDENGRFPCPISTCASDFPTYNDAITHIQQVHDGLSFECTSQGCNHIASSQLILYQHLRENHLLQPGFPMRCPIKDCPEKTVFVHKERFQRHLVAKHKFSLKDKQDWGKSVSTLIFSEEWTPTKCQHTRRTCACSSPDEIFQSRVALLHHLLTDHHIRVESIAFPGWNCPDPACSSSSSEFSDISSLRWHLILKHDMSPITTTAFVGPFVRAEWQFPACAACTSETRPFESFEEMVKHYHQIHPELEVPQDPPQRCEPFEGAPHEPPPINLTWGILPPEADKKSAENETGDPELPETTSVKQQVRPVCPICPVRREFESSLPLRAHLMCVHELPLSDPRVPRPLNRKTWIPRPCSYCSNRTVYANPKPLEQHIKKHHPTISPEEVKGFCYTPQPAVSSGSGSEPAINDLAIDPLLGGTPSDNPGAAAGFQCGECVTTGLRTKPFASRQALCDHLARQHGKTPEEIDALTGRKRVKTATNFPRKCPRCSKKTVFIYPYKLRTHLNAQHKDMTEQEVSEICGPKRVVTVQKPEESSSGPLNHSPEPAAEGSASNIESSEKDPDYSLPTRPAKKRKTAS